MDHDERGRAGKLDTEVPIADRVEAVATYAGEAQFARYRFSIDRIRRTRQRRRTKRQNVYSPSHIPQAFPIAFEHLEIGKAPVRKQNRLGPLQVGVTGDQCSPVSLS